MLSFNRMKRKIYIFIAIAAFGVLLFLFSRDPSKASIIGKYHRVFLGVNETVLLHQNGSFEQKLVFPDGRSWSTNGEWLLIHRAVQFSKFYYYCDDATGALIDTPVYNSSVTFEVQSGGLSREFQTMFQKSNSME
jgi:hypothetical protein